MKRAHLFILTGSCVLSASLCAADSTASTKQGKEAAFESRTDSKAVYVFKQNSKVMGKHIVRVSADGLYMVNPESGFQVIMRKPKWNVITYSRPAKCYLECPLSEYRGFRTKMIADITRVNFLLVPVYFLKKTETKKGIGAFEFVSVELLPPSRIRQLKKTQKVVPTWKLTDREAAQVSYRVLDQGDFPPQVMQFLSTYYGVPRLSGIPLSYRYKLARHQGMRNLLTTESMTRQDELDIPAKLSGYRQVHTEKELFGDKFAEGTMGDFIEYLDSHRRK